MSSVLTVVRPQQIATAEAMLAKIEGIKHAIVEARSFDELKTFVDAAEAIRYAIKRAGLTTDVYNEAAEAKLIGDRLLGRMLSTMPKAKGSKGKIQDHLSGDRTMRPPEEAPTYTDLGIQKDKASRWQQLAALPEQDFAAYIAERKEKQEEITSKGLIEIARRRRSEQARQRNETLKEASKSISAPTQKYKTIVVDPPWDIKKIVRDVRPNQTSELDYPTMSLEEIKAFPIPAMAQDASHLYLWTTHKYLPKSFEVLEAWGFGYVFTLVWHKSGGFQPVGLAQYNCEFVLFGRKGGLAFDDTKNFFACFNAPRREHSRKPDVFYELVKRVSPGPRIEVFSREPRDGFDQFGNEADKFQGEVANA